MKRIYALFTATFTAVIAGLLILMTAGTPARGRSADASGSAHAAASGDALLEFASGAITTLIPNASA